VVGVLVVGEFAVGIQAPGVIAQPVRPEMRADRAGGFARVLGGVDQPEAASAAEPSGEVSAETPRFL
jgi:hypothetical protein